jgi:transmembrane protein TMEM260 (protein O-mannosyltransferase)
MPVCAYDNGRRCDLLVACASAATSGAIFAATMFPGLVGIGDTPKLQFVGPVLGTPHSPGYPLYVLLSWLFAQAIPFGTMAFRVNLLSVVCGTAATGLFTLVLRELGCRRGVCFAGAVAIALGRLFWSQAILAEVYMLNAVLFAGVLLFLLRWSKRRRHADLAAALAFFGAGLAHHLTLAMTAPALTLFALAVDHRVITRRVVATAAIACGAGLMLYGLLWLRTSEGAPFLEARASSVRELFAVVSARQFQDALFQFTPAQLATVRVPLVWRWIADELRWPGIILAAIAAVVMVRRQGRELFLLAGCFGMVIFFALNYDVYDVQVFLLIPLMVLGLLAAVGLDAVLRIVDLRRVPAAATIAALLLPYGQYRANIRVNDQRRHTYETRFFDALFEALPDRTAIVSESYPIDHMVLYKLIGEHAGRGRRIEIIKGDPDTIQRYVANGFTVFAFLEGRANVEWEGVAFRTANLGLPNPAPIRHIYDADAYALAYGISIVTSAGGAGRSEDSMTTLEPITGAALQLPQ